MTLTNKDKKWIEDINEDYQKATIFICIILILIATIFIFSMSKIEKSKTNIIIFKENKTQTLQNLLEQKVNLENKIYNLELKLIYLKKILKMVEMDLESFKNNMTVKYMKILNSNYFIRIEYNKSAYDDIKLYIKPKVIKNDTNK